MIKLKHNLVFVFALLLLSLVAFVDSKAQCAMCQATLESNAKTGTSQIGSTLNNGILYLMSIPYVLIGTIGFLWYRNSKKNKVKLNQIDTILDDKSTTLQS